MEHLRPNEQRAKSAIVLIWIVLAFEIISFISSYFQYDLLQTAANGGQISMEYATANDTRERIVGITSMIVYIISAITFIQWFRRAYYNLHLRAELLSYTEGWAAGSWFVPIVNLIRPYRIMTELYEETNELLVKKVEGSNQYLSTTFLSWWWGLWILNNFIGQFIFKYSIKAESIEELTTSTVASMISNIIGIALALITIKVIRGYSIVEPLLNQINTVEETTTHNSGFAQ